MRPVETIPGMVGGRIKENDAGMNSGMTYLTYARKFCKYHNVTVAQQ
jgi:hypothetical protein